MAAAKIPARALVDTGALVALANPRDQYHRRARRTARAIVESGARLIGTTMVLGEFHGLMLYRTDPARARAVLRALVDDPLYEWREVTVAVIEAATSAWLERFGDQRFSLVDAVNFTVMKREKVAAAFAYDRHFRTAGFQLLG